MTVSRGYSFGATEQVTNAKLHTLVDSATVSAIVNADISAAAAIDESKINFDGSTVCKLSTTQTVTGNKTFSVTTNIYNLIGSLASINTIQSQTQMANNAIVPSMASISNLNVQNITGAFRANQSLVSISSLNVGTLNGLAVQNLASVGMFYSCPCSNAGTGDFTGNHGLFGSLIGCGASYGTIMISSGLIGNIKYDVFAEPGGLRHNSITLYKNRSPAWMYSLGSLVSLAAIGSLISFAAGDLLSWSFTRDVVFSNEAHQSVSFKIYPY